MQILRTTFWVVLTALLVGFILINAQDTALRLWWAGNDAAGNPQYYDLHWPLGVVVLVAFLAGLLPTWLFAKAGRWRLHRRIATLENSARAQAVPPAPPPSSEEAGH